MAYSIVDTGVQMTRGRGAAKVSLVISFKDLEDWAKKQKIDTAKLMNLSFLRACKGLKDKFCQIMKAGGGLNGVPKFQDFEEFTKTIRSMRNKTTPMGGMLAERGSVYGGKSGSWYYVGWKDYLENAAKKFQDGEGGPQSEKWFTDPDYRRTWHMQGLKEIPRQYVHNRRQVLPEPFGSYVQQNLETWANGAFYKELAKQMQKGAK